VTETAADPKGPNKDKSMNFKYVAIICIAILAIAIGGGVSGFGPARAWLQFGMGSITLVTFFAFFWADPPHNSERVRNAVACSMIVTYLMLVITFLFFHIQNDIPAITQSLLTNFTTTIGIVIASYFGATAFIDSRKNGDDTKEK